MTLKLKIELNDILDFIDERLYQCNTLRPLLHAKALHENNGYEEALKDLHEFLKDKFK